MPRDGTRPLAVCAAWGTPSRHQPNLRSVTVSGRQVLTFHARAKIRLAPPICRTPSGQSTGSPQTCPGTQVSPRFRRHWNLFSTRHQRFAHARLPDPHLTRSQRAFPTRSPRPALNRRSLRPFGTFPCRAIPKDLPPSLAQHRERMTTCRLLRVRDTRPAKTHRCHSLDRRPVPPAAARIVANLFHERRPSGADVSSHGPRTSLTAQPRPHSRRGRAGVRRRSRPGSHGSRM